jgi:hypothetical protein
MEFARNAFGERHERWDPFPVFCAVGNQAMDVRHFTDIATMGSPQMRHERRLGRASSKSSRGELMLQFRQNTLMEGLAVIAGNSTRDYPAQAG